MVRKKIDNRIRVLIENGVHTGHRSMFVVVGDKGRDQVVILHHMLSKAEIKARPSVLWCYSKELGFSSHRKKRMRLIQKKIVSGKLDVNEDDPFELFVASTDIRYCYYAETHKILGNTYGMCVLQDFEALTPNILARTIETVEGGGIIVILLRSVNSLKQLYTMTMDCHARFRTEAHQDVVGRFNERFMLSLGSCNSCVVMDDSLNILPLSSNIASITPVEPTTGKETPEQIDLLALKESLKDTQPVGVLMNCCRTLDQGKALLKFIDAISEKKLDATVSLTAARGRGKSAALGLAMSAAIAFGYSNIYVTSPSPENLNTLFEFIFIGTDALQYQEHTDYELIRSTNPEFKNTIVRVNFFRDHRQTIQYIHPTDAQKLGQAELLVIDEAAAIPLPLVKSLFGPYLIFLSSTISGYEGTGRSLSLKLIQQLRNSGPSDNKAEKGKTTGTVSGRVLREVSLEESIRYKKGDDVESWLTNILCLDATLTQPITTGCPQPKDCELYYINRDTLFSYHKGAEKFLHRIMSLYVASHYKNSPNDLQLMSDAPAHHLFCLLGPVSANSNALPEVLCVIQVCLEGDISKGSAAAGLQRGKSASGDLIPWTLSQQFQDTNFPSLSGARIVRIATHPDYQGMGYGTRALYYLRKYYEGEIIDVDENTVELEDEEIETVEEEDLSLLTERIVPRKILPPLLLKLSERPPENLQYLGVSYGLTLPLLKFWKQNSFVPVYLRQTPNDLTGEHTCIMVTLLVKGETKNKSQPSDMWVRTYFKDFRRRYLALLGYQFRTFSPSLALSVIQSKCNLVVDIGASTEEKAVSPEILKATITPYDMKRLDLYTKNMSDYHVIMDLIPALARFHFLGHMGELKLSSVQAAILLGLGLQHKIVDDLAKEMDVGPSQLLGLFVKAVRKILERMEEILEIEIVGDQIVSSESSGGKIMTPVSQSLFTELEEGAKVLKKKQAAELERLKKDDLSQYAIKGSDEAWSDVLTPTTEKLQTKAKQIVTIKSGEKRVGEEVEGDKKKKKKKPGLKEDGKKSFGKGWKKGGKKK